MKEAVLEVLMYLLDKPFSSAQSAKAALLCAENIQTDKLSSADIDKTLQKLNELALWYTQSLQNPLPALRIFTAEESHKLDSECQGFILFLEHCGILNTHTREWIIEYVLSQKAPVYLEQLPWITALVLLNHTHLSKAGLSLLTSLDTHSSVH